MRCSQNSRSQNIKFRMSAQHSQPLSSYPQLCPLASIFFLALRFWFIWFSSVPQLISSSFSRFLVRFSPPEPGRPTHPPTHPPSSPPHLLSSLLLHPSRALLFLEAASRTQSLFYGRRFLTPSRFEKLAKWQTRGILQIKFLKEERQSEGHETQTSFLLRKLGQTKNTNVWLVNYERFHSKVFDNLKNEQMCSLY